MVGWPMLLTSGLPRGNKDQRFWDCLDRTEPNARMPYWDVKIPELGDRGASWMGLTENHPAGTLCLFWLLGLGAFRQHTAAEDSAWADEYKQRLEYVLADSSWFKHLGGFVLTSRFEELFRGELKWAEEFVLPLLGT